MTSLLLLILALIITLIKADPPPNAIQSSIINATGCTLNYYAPPINFTFVGCTTPAGDSNHWNICVTRCCLNTISIDPNTPSLQAII